MSIEFVECNHTFKVCDALEGLNGLPNNSIDSIITSPPYFQCRDYTPGQKNTLGSKITTVTIQLGHENTPFEFIRRLANIFSDGKYLKDDGSIWIIIGDTFAQKNFKDDKKIYPDIKKGESIGAHHLLTMEMRRKGWMLWQEIIWNKPSVPPSGAAKRRCNPCHEYIMIYCKNTPIFNTHAIREVGKTKAGTKMPPVGGKKYGDYKKILISDGMKCRQDVWTITPSRNKSSHVAPFPEEIVEIAIKASTVEGDVICDPFCGTLTVQKVCEKLNRSTISFDIYDHNNL